MNNYQHYRKLMSLAKETGYELLMEKLFLQDNTWTFPECPVVAGKEEEHRFLFEVRTLKIVDDQYGSPIIEAFGNTIRINDGAIEKVESSQIKNIIYYFLPSEFEQLESRIPSVHVDKETVKVTWENIPGHVIVIDTYNKESTVHFDKASKEIIVDEYEFRNDEALMHMNRIAALAKKHGNYNDAVQKWYNENNFDLPF
ncbi:MAG: hypothetical protein IJ161_08390 [Bacteroidales bacterium]|nr:hypothetical protein [Bacteroidales bacterium]